MPPPDPPPNRTQPGDYHFHCYDYPRSKEPWKLSEAQPQRNQWRFYSMEQDLYGLFKFGRDVKKVPNIDFDSLGMHIKDDDVECHVIALSFGGPQDYSNTPEVVITGGIHAREWVAPEMAYLLAEYLIRNYNDAPGTTYEQTLHDLIKTRRIHIIPMLNPSGNHYSVFSTNENARMWRKNRRELPTTPQGWKAALTDKNLTTPDKTNPPFRNAQINRDNNCEYEVPLYDPDNQIPPNQAQFKNFVITGPQQIGVDVNRNFLTPAWGYLATFKNENWAAKNESYFGPSPASEDETRSIQNFILNHANIRTSIDYHSFAKAILYPTEASYGQRVDENYKNLGRILQFLIGPHVGFSSDYNLGTPKDVIGYNATGTLPDYIVNNNINERAFTIELDPGPTTKDGFQLPEDQIQTVFEKNIRGALALIASAGQPSTVTSAFFQSPKIKSTENQFVYWQVFGRGNQLPV